MNVCLSAGDVLAAAIVALMAVAAVRLWSDGLRPRIELHSLREQVRQSAAWQMKPIVDAARYEFGEAHRNDD